MIYACFFKRLIDFLISLFLIVLLLPFLSVIAAIIALETKEVPFFTQKRIGKNEKPFEIIKFKTMKSLYDAENQLLPDKFRITKIGAFLRKYSLDELPELVNVLFGNMSLVGPRPLLMQYVPYYTAREKKRHLIRPGITGLAQISGRNFLNWDERLELDVNYVETVSFSLDCKIIWNTFFKVIHADGVASIPDEDESYLDVIRSEKENRISSEKSNRSQIYKDFN